MDTAALIKAKLQNGFALSNTFGRSMRPLIWGGHHTVVVVPLNGEPLVDDLLMFRIKHPDGKEVSVVHRLIEIREVNIYITRGDNCIGCEEVRRDQIIGRVAEVHRISGWRPWHIIPRKKFAVTDRCYRLYSYLWSVIWPLRRLIYALRAKLEVMVRRKK